eukprot:CAMPEP_0203687058 /NCGR_PEP_ID=MMETSP0090-20130426/49384_1 /ASSEMBLY_ACC=CAM_ASM_001088 /TAXON_ID=426623 /ORGANISM="Chaetoceros affinis, Strain CCMP159" /LENGTH=426 /DNA_ID=CAMNT_0050556307 /DNA_START=61 /DNA_END=1341 /DNA_ORIENTATION=-
MSKRAISAATVFLSQINSTQLSSVAAVAASSSSSASASSSSASSSRCYGCSFVESPPAKATFHRALLRKSFPFSSTSTTTSAPLQMKTNRQIIHFESLPSTQDETRRQLQLLATQASTQTQTKKSDSNNCDSSDNSYNNRFNIAITTSLQTNGRGTSGRKWISEKGNTFITIAVPSSDLLQRGNVPITLLPLQVGVIIAQRIDGILKKEANGSNVLDANSNVNVKWPNDVLVNGKKIAGVLIESEQVQMKTKTKGGGGGGRGVVSITENYFLIGIGINYKFAPKIDQNVNSPERGRESTCICDYISSSSPSSSTPSTSSSDEEEDSTRIAQKAKDLGITIANDIWDWVEMQANWDGAAEAVVRNFEHWAEFGQELALRDSTSTPRPNGSAGGDDIVIPISIEKDGRLRVKNKSNGVERLLCADYLL